MSQQFYVSPEQIMKDRADFARKGIARGRSVVVVSCAAGIALVAENTSNSLHKIGEIYDRIAFAAVGKYNEFESLRQAGVRYADVRGYSYDRSDVTARGLASVYAQSLGTVFTAEQKPFEVELAVAEVGATQAGDHIFRLTFDGSITDERSFVAMGGRSDRVTEVLRSGWRADLALGEALRLATRALAAATVAQDAVASGGGTVEPDGGVARAPEHPEAPAPVAAVGLEVAVLDREPASWRSRRRAFRRIGQDALQRLLEE
ncbi:proteasome subunit alpha [Arthrobacter woluwensis]|uniref:Proteasome subunit alpha n=1 Tax=Arthrobacter woluwensis TaxID=156980 RepID=A0A1H4PY67_9MICC|nr:proteasome subunit alpha [Arthrobacter woluwensis]SEC12250.1 proteasome alpha subunit [Arthrobacter woluwensis]